jgi:hypothetical protein
MIKFLGYPVIQQDTHQYCVVKPVLTMSNVKALKVALKDTCEVLAAEACSRK